MAELTRRYIVMAMATEGPFDPRDPDTPFVLKPWKDPAALAALEAYREHCYSALAQEIDAWIQVIRRGPVIRGGVGARNEEALAGRRPTAPARAVRRPRRQVKVRTQVRRVKRPKKKPKKR